MWEVIAVYDHHNEKWDKVGKVRMITPEDVLQFYGVKNYKASGRSYFCASATRCRFFDLNSAGRTWNDNVIWVKGVKSKVERKESLLDEVAEEETELEFLLEGLGLSINKRVDSRSKKALPASGTTGSGETVKEKRREVKPSGKSGEKVVRHVKGIWLGIEEEKTELKKANIELEKELARPRTDALKEVETKANLDEMVKERDRLGRYLMLKGYYEEEVDAIKANTYVEEQDEEEAEAVGIVDGLDGVSRQTVFNDQGDDAEIPEGNSEKVELDSSRSREGDILMYNREFAEQFDRMKVVKENREDQYVKVDWKDAEIGKGLKELAEVTECVEKLQSWVDALVLKGKQADTVQYRIQALERSEERFRYDL
ncbi:hypothetical protein GIB67_014605 [Kingdonia uniflora]|uniref:Uncharacterized protein n=1 Tax=Kingdonia uniflora TaxID=39325 RepID=A0A7J7MP09_9MAGN|nr:hypothetical protein GIB67_014605 [Kingdonia uniflora]